VCAELLEQAGTHTLIITPSFERASKLAESLSFFTEKRVLLLPDAEPFLLSYEAKSRGELDDRLRALAALRRDEPVVIVCSASAALKKMLPPDCFYRHVREFQVSSIYNDSAVREELSAGGYERTPFAEASGEYSVRGDIIDIYPADTVSPVRLEFFGDELDSLRFFDPDTQKSIRKLDSFTLYPAADFLPDERMCARASEMLLAEYEAAAGRLAGTAAENAREKGAELAGLAENLDNRQLLENYIAYFTDSTAVIADYFPSGSVVFIDDPSRIVDVMRLREEEAARDFESLLESGAAAPLDFGVFRSDDDRARVFASESAVFFTPEGRLPAEAGGVSAASDGLATCEYTAKPTPLMGGSLELLRSELNRYIKEGFEITIVCSSDDRYESLQSFLTDNEFTGRVSIAKGRLASGIELTSEKRVWLFDGDIFKTAKSRKRLRSMDDRKPLRAFTELETGDYVVHEIHGIARYEGIEQKTIQGVRRDYLKLAYAAGDLIYVPVDMMKNVHKYIGGGDEAPKLHKLKGSEWKNAKARAKAGIVEMAAELVELAAQRQARPGYAFSPDTVWQGEFEDLFPYEETGDQLRAIESVKRDMEKPEAMERLLCGDVGYGKTEVALRAVFKCVCDGKQAAILVPTTILANQHFKTFSARFENFPFKVEMLSRFRTAAEQKKIVAELERGTVDVIIGTHRLLSKDVKFRDIGLLIIDEEQRFGVRNKEKIKQLKQNIDVLSMTATPIPRTLHMSLMGIRDMDVIEEPPEDRYPVRTYMMEESDEIVRETILRELDRGGQIYAVTSRIERIDRIAADIARLVPSVSIAAGHGRMNESELEDVMADFVEGKYDVLVSTTIIESGIDIPNVNTILIFDADRFGLSQLYQLRGRVGRTNRVAFAYLLHTKGKVLTEIAEKRMRTIRDFAEFGAGFKIAIRDLEIRGAGNLLGSQQHGHMAAIGYEMYLQLVEEAIAAVAGNAVEKSETETFISIDEPAYIPDYYIEDEPAKLQAYRTISLARSADDEESIVSELADRFGPVPESVKNLLLVARLRFLAERLGITRITQNGGDMLFSFDAAQAASIDRAEAVIGGRDDGSLRFNRGNPAIIRLFAPAGNARLRRSIALLCDILNDII
jgi:transcription-repair coupling factor (superfamily II helicase)